MSELELRTDGERSQAIGDDNDPANPATGVFVRAFGVGGAWRSADIYELNKESLIALLAAKPKVWVDNLVLILLGHEP